MKLLTIIVIAIHWFTATRYPFRVGSRIFRGGGLSNIVYAHCKVKSVRGGVLKQNFKDNNTRSVSLSLAVTPALSG